MAKASKPAAAAAPSKPVARTGVRNSPIPQVAPAPNGRGTSQQKFPSTTTPSARPTSKPISQELIARRAYEIWASGQGGTDLENWIRAERELRGI
ncbi:MAG: hypothetical protein QOF78_1359 [Phycisphaerales bacterium]|jgi:hypothetical protein|nr:hypothetical protein [Phycisphaerales bacterium]